jgi:Domain of unknown function (DUF4333)
MVRHTRFAVPVVVTAGALALAGCGDKVIDQGKAQSFTKQIVAANGGTAKSAKCASDVKVKKGKTFDCTATLANGQKFKITFQMTDNKGTVKFVNATKQ